MFKTIHSDFFYVSAFCATFLYVLTVMCHTQSYLFWPLNVAYVVCVHVCVRVIMYRNVYVCMLVGMCIFACVFICVHVYM